MEIRLLFTTDAHGLLRRDDIQRNLSTIAARHAAHILLDAGDALAQDQILPLRAGELAAMFRLGYAAVAVGNREFHEVPSLMRRKVGPVAPPLLGANLAGRKDSDAVGEWFGVRPHVILDVGGARVAVIGIMSDGSRPTKPAEVLLNRACRRFLPARFRAPSETVREQVAEVRAGCELVVLLSHAGLPTDRVVSRATPGLDIVLSGHSHSRHPLPNGHQLAAPIIHEFSDLRGRFLGDGLDGRPHRQNVAVCVIRIDTSASVLVSDVCVYDLRDGNAIPV